MESPQTKDLIQMGEALVRRRELLGGAIASALGCGLSVDGFAKSSSKSRDRFGGWTGKRFDATGFFRVEKDDRWWFVTPEGNAFLSFGINHLTPDLWRQEYNRDAWQQRLGLDDLKSREFASLLRAWFLATCQEYGFNTVGVHSSLPIVNTPRPAMPYMLAIRFVDIPHWRSDVPDRNFRDVFSEEFARHCDDLARSAASTARNDPYLLGYAMTDCPLFTEEDCRERPDVIGGARRRGRVGWPRWLRNMPSDAPGKQAYVATMKRVYRGDVNDFNTTYGTDFASFDSLASATDWRLRTDLSNANETRDNILFLQAVVEKYYQTTRDAIRRYDPNHLFFGDKLNANTDSADTVLPITSKYTDVIFYQMYGRYEVQQPPPDRWARLVDKPIVNGDSSYTMITDQMPRPFGPVADSLEQRAEWTQEFFVNAFARPDFIGWHYCGLIDAPNLIPRKRGRQHSGILTGYGEPYPQLLQVFHRCAEQMYQIAERG